MNPSEVCVLIPAYNEEKNIARVVGQVRGVGFSVLVVDDGSTDGTLAQLKSLNVPFIGFPVNQGKGTALRKGFEWFLEGSLRALIVMDADGQHDPSELGSFLRALNDGQADVVVGNRMQFPEKMPWVRVTTNHLLSRIISLIARQDVPDSQCGYRALTRAVVERISLTTRRFEIESEILLEAGRLGFRIRSIPIRSVYAGEKSQIRPLPDTLRFFQFLIRYLSSKKAPPEA